MNRRARLQNRRHFELYGEQLYDGDPLLQEQTADAKKNKSVAKKKRGLFGKKKD